MLDAQGHRGAGPPKSPEDEAAEEPRPVEPAPSGPPASMLG
jgi:hypothetical protein